MFIPSSFSEYHKGPSDTFMANGGTLHRLDYTAIPLSWPSEEVQSRAVPGLDMYAADSDHILLTTHAVAQLKQSVDVEVTRRKPLCSRAAMKIPDNVSYCNQIMAAMPIIPWVVHVNDHYGILLHWKQYAMHLAFPLATHVSLKPWLSAAAWNPIGTRTKCNHCLASVPV